MSGTSKIRNKIMRIPTIWALIVLLAAQIQPCPLAAASQDQSSQLNPPELPTKPLINIPELKLDLPKLDKTKPPVAVTPAPRIPLKGSVQHLENIKGKGKSQHEGMANINGLTDGNAKLDGKAQQSKLDSSLSKQSFRSNVTQNNSDQMGLGIIGVKFVMAYGRMPIIYEVFPGTPAEEVGMRPRDVIVAVDGIPTAGLSKDEVYNMIVGQPNTNVTISFKRKNDFQVRQLTRMDLNKINNPFLRRDYLKM